MGCSRCVCSATCDPHVSTAALLQADEIVELCDNAERLFKQEKSVLELRVRVLEAAMMQGALPAGSRRGISTSSAAAASAPCRMACHKSQLPPPAATLFGCVCQ